MIAEVVLIEGDGGAVGILEALLGLECFAEDVAGDDAVTEVLQKIEYIGLNGVFTVLLNEFNLNLRLLIDEFVLLFLPGERTAEVYVTVSPYREMIELELGKLAHVGTFNIKVEVLNPLIISGVLVKIPGSRS